MISLITDQVATRYARWTVAGILALFVVDLAVPRVAKPWIMVCLGQSTYRRYVR